MLFVASSMGSPVIRAYLKELSGKYVKKEVDLPHFTIPLLYKIMQVSKAWRAIAASDRIWQGIGDRLGVIFSAHLRNPKRFKFLRPDERNGKLLYKSMLLWHAKIYPKIPQDIRCDPYYQEPLKRHTPSKMEQVKDFYAETNILAYHGCQKEAKELLGSLEIDAILNLKKINEAVGCLEIRRCLAIAGKIYDRSQEDDLVKWCQTHADKLSKVINLDLQNCELCMLPDIFKYLPNLDFLELRSNNLTKLPPSIGKLSKLTYLGLTGNQLTTLPDSMKHLKNLWELDLFLNDLNELPYWINGLSLTSLKLGRNHLTSLPFTICDIPQLRELDLKGNKLTELPERIGQLTNLQFLSLESNKLKSLPSSFTSLVKLTSFHLEGNPMYEMRLIQKKQFEAKLREAFGD